MRVCFFCGDFGDGEEHHFIPRFLEKHLNVKINIDDYRIILCESCHTNMTTKWEEIRRNIE